MIDVSQWRASIGLWNGSSYCRLQYCSSSSSSSGKGVSGLVCSSYGSTDTSTSAAQMMIGMILLLVASLLLPPLLLILSGDVELNPGPGKDEAVKQLRLHSADLATALTANLIAVSNKLHAKDLITFDTKNELQTARDVSEYERASILVSVLQSSVRDHPAPYEYLHDVCDVFIKQPDHQLTQIATAIMSQGPSEPEHVRIQKSFIQCRDELIVSLASNDDISASLASVFCSDDIIDKELKGTVRKLKGKERATILVSGLEQAISKQPEIMPKILDGLDEEDCLHDIVLKIRAAETEQSTGSPKLKTQESFTQCRDELIVSLASNDDVSASLASVFCSDDIIDKEFKGTVRKLKGKERATILVSGLEQAISKQPEIMPKILDGLDEEDCLHDIVLKMRTAGTEQDTQSLVKVEEYIDHSDYMNAKDSLAKVAECIDHPDYINAQGIIFITCKFGAAGTTVDVDRVRSTFKQLNFAVYSIENANASQIDNAIKAAAKVVYPQTYKFIVFYFAGHGGKDESGAYIVLSSSKGPDDDDDIFHVERCIVEPLKHLTLTRLFLFDCCLTRGSGRPYNNGEQNEMLSHPGMAIAFATSTDQTAIGSTKHGGLWTRTLCEKLLQEKPIVETLTETADAVAADERGEKQRPMMILSLDGKLTIRKELSSSESSHFRSSEVQKVSPVAHEQQSAPILKGPDNPDLKPNPKQLLKKSPEPSDVLAVVKEECDNEQFRELLKVPKEGDLPSVINHWIREESTDVTWKHLLKALNGSSNRKTAIFICKDFLIQSSVYDKYKVKEDFKRFDDLLSDSSDDDDAEADVVTVKSNSTPADLPEVCDLLKSKSNEWYIIGQGLKVDYQLRQNLQTDMQKRNEQKLEEVLNNWLETHCSPPTWENLTKVLEEIQLRDVIEEIKMHLEKNNPDAS